MKKFFNDLIGITGYQIKKKKYLYDPHKNLIKSIKHFKIKSIIDVGANKGQFALRLLNDNFEGNIMSFEPFLKCDAALLCPESGIVDSYALMLSLVVLGGNHGLTLATRSRVISGKPEKGFWRVYTIDESGKKTFVRARWVVNAAGIWATGISRSTFPLRTIPEAHPVKGSYLQLTGPSPVSRIIYPDLVPGKISERVDATPGIDGKLRFGPSVDAAASYEDYRVADNLKERLTPLIQRYLLNYNTLKLSPDYAGVRPKIKTPGNGAPDFIFDWADEGGWLDLWGMESPGLTSALAIAEHVEFLAGETGLI